MSMRTNQSKRRAALGRLALGHHPEKVATALGVSRSTVFRWKRDANDPRVSEQPETKTVTYSTVPNTTPQEYRFEWKQAEESPRIPFAEAIGERIGEALARGFLRGIR